MVNHKLLGRKLGACAVAVALATTSMPAECFTPVFVHAQEEESSGMTTADYCKLDGVATDNFQQPYAQSVTQQAGTDLPIVYASNYDEDYQSSYITPIKNQGSQGTCWAHETTALMETAILKKNSSYTTTSAQVDLSENDMKHCLSNKAKDPATGIRYGYDRAFNGGGNFMMGVSYFTRTHLNGTVLESIDPYSASDTARTYAEIKAINDQGDKTWYVTDTINIGYVGNSTNATVKESQRNAVKQAIMDYGIVGMSYYSETAGYNNSGSDYGYTYFSKKTSTNHGVCIVGWNDNIPASCFKNGTSKPSMNGGWLVKNSWGTGSNNAGYFWMSYDSYMDSLYCITNVEQRSALFNHIYELDEVGYQYSAGFGYGTSHPTLMLANKFQKSGEDEDLTGVSLITGRTDEYAKVYVSTTGEWGDLQEVKLSNCGDYDADKGYNLGLAGFKYLELTGDTQKQLTGEGKFIVAFQLYHSSGMLYFGVDSFNRAGANESFYAYDLAKMTAGTVTDYGKANGYNICMKAFTTDTIPPSFTCTAQTKNISYDYLDEDDSERTAAFSVTVTNTANTKLLPSRFSLSTSKTSYVAAEDISVTALSADSGSVNVTISAKRKALTTAGASYYLSYKGKIVSTNAITLKRGTDTAINATGTTVSTSTISKYAGTSRKVSLPTKIGTTAMKTIGASAFANLSTLQRVVIADGYTTIGAKAFANCVNLTEVVIPDSVTSIASDAFSGCPNVYITCSKKVGNTAYDFAVANGLTVASNTLEAGGIIPVRSSEVITVDYDSQTVKVGSEMVGLLSVYDTTAAPENLKWQILTTVGKASANAKIQNATGKYTLATLAGAAKINIGALKANAAFNNMIVIRAVDTKNATKVYADCTVAIRPALPTSITMAENAKQGITVQDGVVTVNAYVNTKVTLKPTVLPAIAGNKNVIYEITGGDQDAIQISSAGVITPKKVTTEPVVVTIRTEEYGEDAFGKTTTPAASLTVKVNVNQKATAMTAVPASLSIAPGKIQSFTLSLAPLQNSLTSGKVIAKYDSSVLTLQDASGATISNGSTITLNNGLKQLKVQLKSGKLADIKTAIKGKNVITFSYVKPYETHANVKDIKVTVNPIGTMTNVTKVNQSGKVGADGNIALNIPVGIPYNAGVSVAPATAKNMVNWTTDSSAVSGVGPYILATDPGVATMYATSVAKNADMSTMQSKKYVVNAYRPTSYVRAEAEGYELYGGVLMTTEEAKNASAGFFNRKEIVTLKTVTSKGSTEPVVWTSSNVKGLELVDNGDGTFTLTMKKPGTYKVTGKAKYSGTSYAFTVKVANALAASITPSRPTIYTKPGSTQTVYAVAYGVNDIVPEAENITWKTDNSELALPDAVVTTDCHAAVKITIPSDANPGTTKVTGIGEISEKKFTITVNVVEDELAPGGITINSNRAALVVAKDRKVKLPIVLQNPKATSDGVYEWVVSYQSSDGQTQNISGGTIGITESDKTANPDLPITIDRAGNIKGIKAGTATLKVKYVYGSSYVESNTITITVK